MKRKIATIVTSLALVVVLLATLCACGSTWGSIKGAFEKEGYEEVDISEDLKKLYESNEDFKAAGDTATIHIMKKSLLEVSIILEFKSNKDMEEALKKHVTKEDAENIYEELQKLDTVNGNCFLIVGDTKIFKGTK